MTPPLLHVVSFAVAPAVALMVLAGASRPALAAAGPAPLQGRGQPPPRDLRPVPAPPRDPGGIGQAVPVGKGVITGQVVVAGTGQPARRARVNLNGSDGIGSRVAVTDDAGRFSLSTLPEGRYSLSASKPGYLEGTFGQKAPGRSGTAIQLADGQKMQVQLQVWKGSVITGTLLDEHGEATPNTPVRVLRYVLQSGQRTLQQAGNGETDDRGVYRIFGLRPGEYLVTATPRNTARSAIVEQRMAVESVMQRASEVAASNPEQARSLAERAAQLKVMLGTAAVEEEPPTGYAPVYYPGTTSPASAATVVLGASEEKSGIDFQYQVVPVSRIEGVVTSSVQLPPNIQISLVNTAFNVPGLNPGGARVDAQGSFRIANVPLGQYTIIGRATIGQGRQGGPAGRGAPPARPEPAGRGAAAAADPVRLWGSADVSVDGRNVSNVVLTLQPGVTVSGRVVFDGATPPPADLTRLRVTLQPIVTPGMPNEGGSGAGRVEADGRFTITSVVPGRYRMSSAGAGAPWTVGSAVIDGQDAFEFPMEIKGAASGAVVTLVDRQSELTGTVTNSQSQPVTDYTLVLYPADQRYRTPYSRRIHAVRPATDGRFSFRALPAGEYRLATIMDPEPGSWYDPAFLQQIDASAVSVSLGDGEKKEQGLRVPGGG